jgi:hypothetical protein
MRPIRYANRTVALRGDDVLLEPEIAALDPTIRPEGSFRCSDDLITNLGTSVSL